MSRRRATRQPGHSDSSFPRPAFEIWLPLPTLLAAVPMLLLGSTSYAATLAVPVLLGSVIPVLAWRIGADLAAERGLSGERARTLGLGSGLVSAVVLPLVLPSALLDSTVPFGVAALAACLLGTRLLREPRGARVRDPRLVGLGLALGLAALTRNEAIWIALAWAALAWWQGPDGRTVRESRAMRARLVLVPAVVAIAVVAPWLVRQAIVFGSPLPGQAITNAWAISGFEIFAWKEPATLAGYLAAGPAAWLDDRVGGFWHNLVSVLVLPGIPVAAVGLAGLPWVARCRALRLLVVSAVATFAITTLVFPVQTTWGTYLHAAAPAHVLLIVSGLAVLDAGTRMGRAETWVDAARCVARPALRRRGCAPLPGPRDSLVRQQRRRDGGALRGADSPLRGPGRSAGPERPGDRQPPDLGRRGEPRPRPGAPGRARLERAGDRPDVQCPLRGPGRDARHLAGPPRDGPRRPLPGARSRSRPRLARQPEPRTSPSTGSRAHDRPVYCDGDERRDRGRGCRDGPLRQRLRGGQVRAWLCRQHAARPHRAVSRGVPRGPRVVARRARRAGPRGARRARGNIGQWNGHRRTDPFRRASADRRPRGQRAGRARDRALAPGACGPRAGTYVALPGTGRCHAAGRPVRAGPPRRPADAAGRGPGGGAPPPGPGGPRWPRAGARERDLPGRLHRAGPRHRSGHRARGDSLPAGAPAPPAGRRARLHHPAAPAAPGRARAGWIHRGRRRDDACAHRRHDRDGPCRARQPALRRGPGGGPPRHAGSPPERAPPRRGEASCE